MWVIPSYAGGLARDRGEYEICGCGSLPASAGPSGHGRPAATAGHRGLSPATSSRARARLPPAAIAGTAGGRRSPTHGTRAVGSGIRR